MEQGDTRNLLLDAAARIVTWDGISSLTLEATAREAGVSKGGLLYHFSSKRKLIEGLLNRQLDAFEADVYKELAREPEAPGRWLRAYIRATVRQRTAPNYGAGIIAVLVTEPDLFEVLHHRYALWRERLEMDGLDPAVVTLAKMAMDGLRFWRLFGMAPDSDMQDAAVALLVDLTKQRV